jgi:hypothetical protein
MSCVLLAGVGSCRAKPGSALLAGVGSCRAKPGSALLAERGAGHETHTTRSAVITALTVATGSSTFQPKRISWS